LTQSKQYLAERFGAADDEIEDRPRYNIAPTQPVVTVRKEHGKKSRHFTNMRWGLIPAWAKDMSIGTKTLNVRSETLTTTAAFRDSILTKRCLIPADGFYEWELFIMNDSATIPSSELLRSNRRGLVGRAETTA
jgi:putative SOS response-associated peptidase YedK